MVGGVGGVVMAYVQISLWSVVESASHRMSHCFGSVGLALGRASALQELCVLFHFASSRAAVTSRCFLKSREIAE